MRSFRFAVLPLLLAASAAGAQPTSADAARQAVHRYRTAHESEILHELTALLAIPNVASDTAGIRRNVTMLRAMLERRGFATRTLESGVGGSPAVFGELTVPGARRTIVFYAHYDGQPVVERDWATAPWTPTLRDGVLERGGRAIPLPSRGDTVSGDARLYGRSSSDDKAPIVALLASLDALRAAGLAPSVDLKIFLEGEEEAGSDHLRQLLTQHRDLLRADAWIFGDGPRHASGAVQVVYGVRGVLPLQLTVYGPTRPLHSGHYGNWAPNPASRLATLLASMRRDDGTVTVDGFADGVRPPSAAERAAIAALPQSDAALAAELGIAEPEGDSVALAERLLQPALNVTGLSAGSVGATTANAIRTEATAAIDFRLVPGQTPGHVRDVVERHLRTRGWTIVAAEPDSATRARSPRIARLQWGEGYAGVRTDLDTPLAGAVASVVSEAVTGPVLRVPTLGGSLPLAHFVEVLDAPVITLPIVNADNNQHAANENLRLQNLWEGIEIYGQLLARLGVVWTAAM